MQKILETLEGAMADELGGWERITPQQEILLRATIKSYGVVLLTELFVNKYSPLRPDLAKAGVLQYQPVLEKSYLSFLNAIRLNLEKLFPNGLSRKAEDTLDLGRYIAQKDKEAEEQAEQEAANSPPRGG